MLAYGIYKELGNSIEDEPHLLSAYQKTIGRIDKIIKSEQQAYQKKQMPFNLSAFFKKPRCRLEYNKEAGILENDNLIEQLKNLP